MRLDRRQFLKGSARGVVLGSFVVAQATPARHAMAGEATNSYGFMGGKRWRNWAHNVEVRPSRIHRPTCVAELQSIVTSSGRVRAVGSGHSISSIAPTDDTLVNTEALCDDIVLDRERGRVTVGAGMKLLDFNNRLARLGYALPSTGDTFYQSLAGLLSTGTHGTGMRWGSCSDEESLLGMELVLADGSILNLSSDRSEDYETLRAARIGLGALGIMRTVTLHVEPVHNLEHQGRKLSVSDALDPRHYLTNDHYEFAYFPYVNACYGFFRNKTDQKKTSTKLSRWFQEDIVENALAGALLGAAAGDPAMLPGLFKAFYSAYPDSHMIDRCDRIMTTPRKVPAYLNEYAIPIARIGDAIEALDRLVETYRNKPRAERFYPNTPAQVRFVRGDRGNMLSPTQGQDTAWIGIASHVSHKGYVPFFRDFEDRMLELGGRPHWGKMFFRNPRDLYPELDRFNEIRYRLDPTGKFMNRYVERLLSPEKSDADVSKFF